MRTAFRAVANRALQIAIVTFFVTAGTNILVRLVPGDAATAILGSKATPEAQNALRQQLGLDESLPQQVVRSLGRLIQGDLGTSFAYRGQEVASLIGPALAVTASLAAAALIFSLLGGIPVGLGLALVRHSGSDLIGRLMLIVMLAVPSFLAGLIALFAVSLKLGIAPAGGWAGSWPGNLQYVWLPAVALSVYLGALIARAVRQAALETIGQPYIEAARTRGVPRTHIVLFHVLPNAVLPVIPLVGFNAGVLLSGAVTIEAVFALPGLGSQLTQAMNARDLPVVQGIALLTAVSIVVFNLLADVFNTAIDPRIRRAR